MQSKVTGGRGREPAATESDVSDLLHLADHGLSKMRLDSGLFCHTWDRTTGRSQGESVRYSIIVLLGLLRRAQTGSGTIIPPDAVRQAIEPHREGLGTGDLGLLLWADVRSRSGHAESTLAQLEGRAGAARLDELEGMEIAWWVLGAAEAVAAGLPAEQCLDRAIEELGSRRAQASPLFRHLGSGLRSGLPNFATEIYALLALATLARHDLADTAGGWAIELADRLVELQLADGGWPWLYDAERSTVIEPYEIYSVHQDAMAPMAFLALVEATGRLEYLEPVVHGLTWCFGRNELGAQMVDHDGLVVDRSIRHRRPASRIRLAANSLLGRAAGVPARLDIGTVEVNPTCRPYHLGWILEAWSGREELVERATGGRP